MKLVLNFSGMMLGGAKLIKEMFLNEKLSESFLTCGLNIILIECGRKFCICLSAQRCSVNCDDTANDNKGASQWRMIE
jgi:hypothetical protein